LEDNRLFDIESYKVKLRKLNTEWINGGVRVMIERGEPPQQGEIVLKISKSGEIEEKEVFLLPKDRISTL
jgi:hypothetical protein